MHVLFGQWAREDIAVLELSDHEWRVSDLQRREEDGMAVLGCVEQEGDFFFSTGLRHPLERRRFSSLDRAVAHLLTERTSDEQPQELPG